MMKFYSKENTVIAELTDETYLIADPQDFLDLIGDLVTQDCNRIIIHKRNLHEDFFRLHTGLAGEILQKISNYRLRLAIVGDFTIYSSKPLQDFIRESNKGNMVCFTENLDTALKVLVSKK